MAELFHDLYGGLLDVASFLQYIKSALYSRWLNSLDKWIQFWILISSLLKKVNVNMFGSVIVLKIACYGTQLLWPIKNKRRY